MPIKLKSYVVAESTVSDDYTPKDGNWFARTGGVDLEITHYHPEDAAWGNPRKTLLAIIDIELSIFEGRVRVSDFSVTPFPAGLDVIQNVTIDGLHQEITKVQAEAQVKVNGLKEQIQSLMALPAPQ